MSYEFQGFHYDIIWTKILMMYLQGIQLGATLNLLSPVNTIGLFSATVADHKWTNTFNRMMPTVWLFTCI